MKNILILGAIIIVVLGLILLIGKPKEISAPTISQVTTPSEPDISPETDRDTTAPSPAKLKAATFTGTLTKVDTGCVADGECYIEVDGKKVTTLIGFSRDEVGTVIGVNDFGELENHIGQPVEVYAQDNSDGTYTLYGSTGFYVKII